MSTSELCAFAQTVLVLCRFISCCSLAGLALLLTSFTASGQTTYYVAATGNDANDGRSATSPFQSLTKVNSLTYQPGDILLLRRGDTFSGSLTIKQSGSSGNPIVVDAYGSGTKPVVSGAVAVTNWVNVGGNVWQAPCAACGNRVTGLYSNGSALPLGRYPNLNTTGKGYMTVQGHAGKTQLTSQQPLTTNWTGGEVVVRPVQWILDRATITQQNGNTLTLINGSNYDISDGWGYFIQNHPATLDQTGEWYYNPSAHSVQLYYDRGNPNAQLITATAYDQGVSVLGSSFVTIRNIAITQTRSTGLYATNVANFTLSNNDITNAGEDAVTIDGTGSNVLVENNLIDRANNNGFTSRQYQNMTVRGNTIRRVGLVPGRTKSGDGQAIGFQASGDGGLLIEANVLDSLGYSGIVFTNNATIQRNTVSNYCLIKSDGGGIYTWNGNKLPMSNIHILSNIVYNGIGAPEGAPASTYSGANGIYMDDCTQNAEVSANTVFDCYGLGILLHATNNMTVTGNTSFNNRERQFKISHNNSVCPARNNSVHGNIFVSKLPDQLTADYESVDDDLASYGSFDNNYYARPFDDLFKIRAVYKDGGSIVGTDLALSQWQAKFQKDRNSGNSALTYKGYTVNTLKSTGLLTNSFASGTEGWSTWGPYNNGRAVWSAGGQLDAGSLQIDFPTPSGHSDSYLLVFNGVGAVVKAKTYLLRFDAIASGPDKKVQVYLRQQDGPYQDLCNRVNILVGQTRNTYEMAFTATADEAKAILMYQVDEDGKSIWIDNIRLQEAELTMVNPDDYIKLAYNRSTRDTTLTLDAGYRDVKNQLYRQITLAPFTAAVLLKDLAAPALPPTTVDLALSLQSSKRYLAVGDLVSVSVCVRNTSANRPDSPARAQWSCRLPQNLQVVASNGLTYTDGVLMGSASGLAPFTDTTFIFQARPLVAGTYRTAAQLTTATFPDPDSVPGSGTADGEDDAAMVDFRVGDVSDAVFTSPNPNQTPLPIVASSQPSASPTGADLSLRMEMNRRLVAVNDVVSFTITVGNAGGVTASGIQIQNQLPDGLQFISGDGWILNGNLLGTSLSPLAAGSTASAWFQARVIRPGRWVNLAQISAAATTDPDSVSGNGFMNGEDDQAQADIRTW